jgi:hypothetical protein
MFYVYYYRIEEVLRARYGVQKDSIYPDAQPPLILADLFTTPEFLGSDRKL